MIPYHRGDADVLPGVGLLPGLLVDDDIGWLPDSPELVALGAKVGALRMESIMR